MRIVDLLIDVPGKTAEAAYHALADFERYPDLAEAVKSVAVTKVSDTVTRSVWEVAFRAGLLRWSEEDTFDRETRTIAFHQLEGDIALFDGTWSCSDTGTGDGCTIAFHARLDMGIPSLADALEPIAARTLIENTIGIVGGLLTGSRLVESAVRAVTDEATTVPPGAAATRTATPTTPAPSATAAVAS